MSILFVPPAVAGAEEFKTLAEANKAYPDRSMIYAHGDFAETVLGIMRRQGYRLAGSSSLTGEEVLFQGKQFAAACLMPFKTYRNGQPGDVPLGARHARLCYSVGPSDPELIAEITTAAKSFVAKAKP